MNTISRLKSTIQNYAWGSRYAIADLLGEKSPAKIPQAELWMGAHPKSPSQVFYENQWVSLSELIEKYPETILGKAVAEKFHHQLPYLFKVLAAAHPLSIQAHPNAVQAMEGFDRENRLNIPLDDPHRNYRDNNPKPECMCALSPLWALKGFRPIPETCALFERFCPHHLYIECIELRRRPDASGLKQFFKSLMGLDQAKKRWVIQEAIEHINGSDHTLEYKGKYKDALHWIQKLHGCYENDVGALAPLFLNLICLQPGEAMFLDTGEPHAYLEGVGIELMANSDNVLRCGMTPKHVDVLELLNVLTFQPGPIEILSLSSKAGECERIYPIRTEEFVLSVITPGNNDTYINREIRSAEILLCTRGGAWLTDRRTHDRIFMTKGSSALIPAVVTSYEITGDAVLYKAAVPI